MFRWPRLSLPLLTVLGRGIAVPSDPILALLGLSVLGRKEATELPRHGFLAPGRR